MLKAGCPAGERLERGLSGVRLFIMGNPQDRRLRASLGLWQSGALITSEQTRSHERMDMKNQIHLASN